MAVRGCHSSVGVVGVRRSRAEPVAPETLEDVGEQEAVVQT